MSKHRHRHDMDNSSFNPNMLLILLLILSAYSPKTIYNFDEELLNNQHNGASNNDVSRASDTGYTGGVLSENNDSQDEADSNLNYERNSIQDKTEDIGYTGGYISVNPPAFKDNKDKANESYDEYSSRFINSVSDDADCSTIIESEVVQEYPNKLIEPDSSYPKVIVNVPVVLSQFEVEFACEAVITLDRPALDIKRIKKNVYLEQCKLLHKVNKLFIGGVVRKNIEYSTEDDIRHITVEIPFKCTTEVKYFTPPIIDSNEEQLEIETLREDGMGNDLSEKTYVSREHFSEKIYCRLVRDEVRELDIVEKNEDEGESEKPDCEKFFETLTEKMVVKLNLKLMQEQQISINNF